MDDGLDDFLRHFAALSDAAQATRGAEHRGEQIWDAVESHLGVDGASLPVVTEEFGAHRLPDAALALDAAGPAARVVGSAGPDRHHLSLQDMLANRRHLALPVAEPDQLRVDVGPDRQRRIIGYGLFLLDGEHGRLAVLLRGANPQYGRSAGSLEILGTDPAAVDAFAGWFRQRLRTHSIFKGQVVSFTANEHEPTTGGITFHRRPRLSPADVVLPGGVLSRVERHVVGLAEHRERLLAAGQHLKRGVLLYGPPGTGKTHTVRYLLGRAAGATAILLSGGSLALVGEAARMARALQPAVVVLEDCDLVAEDRGFGHGPQPLLFEVLDAMDGLEPDADVAFVLTTNRVEALERALAQRPGRVDLAVEIPRPDDAQRLALLALYAGALPFSPAALQRAARDTAGTTASFAKELVRRAVLDAAMAGHEVSDAHLAAAVGELMADGAALTRSLLGGDGTGPAGGGPADDAQDFGFVEGGGQPPGTLGALRYGAGAALPGLAWGSYTAGIEVEWDQGPDGVAGAGADAD